MLEKTSDSNTLRHLGDTSFHLIERNPVILKGKCNVLTNRESNKLRIRVLKNSADSLRELEYVKITERRTSDFKLSCDFAGIGRRDKTVDAVRKSRFPAAGWAADQNLLTPPYGEVDVKQSRF